MRQDDGADLLGANDPRSANVGIIYVAPNDDRQTVLTAILTQDKLGRKQVAVVLPGQNKAFQRPVDFEGLKNMRRGLKTEIVFIAPAGPGPAEFARQRHFKVFPSLEAFSQSFQANDQSPASARRGLFGRRQKPANGTTPASSTKSTEPESTFSPSGIPVMVPAPVPEEMSAPRSGAINREEEDQFHPYQNGSYDSNGEAVGGVVMAPDLLDVPTVENTSLSPDSEEDWDALPPTAQAPAAVDSSSLYDTTTDESGNNDPQGNAGPGIIVFPTPQSRSRTTGKLPAAVAPAAIPTPPAQPKELPTVPLVKRRNTGKRAAVGAGAVAAGAAAGTGAAMASRTVSTGGTPPPPGGITGGSGGGGGGAPRRRINRSLLAALLILLTLLLVAGIAFAAPGGIMSHVIPGTSPGATVTITPVRHDLKDAFLITAVTGTPDPNQRQIPARKLFYKTLPQLNTVQATGQVNTNPIQATGILTFYNGNGFAYTVRGGTVFTDSHGVQVENVGAVTIPAGNPNTGYGRTTASAIAVVGGTSGNIKAFDFSLFLCCGSGAVYVSNASAFAGGQDSQHYTAVSQSDIDRAANSLKTSQLQSAQKAFQLLIKGTEQLVSPAQCRTDVTPNHKAGDRATSVTVTVTATCTGEVFDQQAARTMATGLLVSEAQKNFGSGYVLLDNKVVTDITSPSIIDANKGTVSLTVKAEGVWYYLFNDATKKNLVKLIAGKSEADAKTLLLQQPGVSGVQITIASGTKLPTDPASISIVIKAVPGLPGTGTPTAPPPESTPTSPTATPTAQPGLGGS